MTLDAVRLWTRDRGWDEEADALRSIRVLAGFTPPYSLAAPAGPEPLVRRVDIMFVCALAEEYLAVVSRFDRVIEQPPSSERFQYELGEIDAQRGIRSVSALVADRAGPIPAAITTYRASSCSVRRLSCSLVLPRASRERSISAISLCPTLFLSTRRRRCLRRAKRVTGARTLPIRRPSRRSRHGGDGRVGSSAFRTPAQMAVRPRLVGMDAEVGLAIGFCGFAAQPCDCQRPHLTPKSISVQTLWPLEARSSGRPSEPQLSQRCSARPSRSRWRPSGCSKRASVRRHFVPVIVIKAVSDFADEAKNDSWHKFGSMAAADLAIALARDHVI